MKSSLTCLLIDDNEDDKDFFERALNKVGADITLYHSLSGKHAINNLKSGNCRPSHIFLDLNMLADDGIGILVEIKKIAACVNTPVIIYSTVITEKIISDTLGHGAFDHVKKPSSQHELEIYLKKILLAG